MTTPTLAGAQHGRSPRPLRDIPGGFWIHNEEGELVNRPGALRVVRARDIRRCEDYARQYLAQRGDRSVPALAHAGLSTILWLHIALVHPGHSEGPRRPIYPLPDNLAGEDGKVNTKALDALQLHDLADGQAEYLYGQYRILLATETPPSLNNEQWEAIVSDAKKGCALRTLILQHGSSALIQVLHGMGDEAWAT